MLANGSKLQTLLLGFARSATRSLRIKASCCDCGLRIARNLEQKIRKSSVSIFGWLNGPAQYEDHKIGKKHKKNTKKPKSQPQRHHRSTRTRQNIAFAPAPPPEVEEGRERWECVSSLGGASSEQTSAPPPASPLMYWPPPAESFFPQSYAEPRYYDPSAYAYPALLQHW